MLRTILAALLVVTSCAPPAASPGDDGDDALEGDAPDPNDGFLEVAGDDEVLADVAARMREIVAREVSGNAAVRPWFSGAGLRVRVVPLETPMSEVPEFVAVGDQFGPIPDAYGLTLPAQTDDGVYFCAVKKSDYVSQSLIHELLHVIGFAAADADAGLPAEMADAYAGSAVEVEGSRANAHENLAYKGQHWLSGNGRFLESADDPVVAILEGLFAEPLFLEEQALSSEILRFAGHGEFVDD